MAATHLNMCAIHSKLDNHQSAHAHCKQAVSLLEFDWDADENTATTIIIAYHNLGIESEHLGRHNDAANAYRTGFTMASSKLGLTHTLTRNLKASYNEVRSHGRTPERSRELFESPVPGSFLPKLHTATTIKKPKHRPTLSYSFESGKLAKHSVPRKQMKNTIYNRRYLTGNRK